MWQVENEYGYCGSNTVYLRHLLATARQQLGDNVILFTTDPPDIARLGSLPGAEVLTCALPEIRGNAITKPPVISSMGQLIQPAGSPHGCRLVALWGSTFPQTLSTSAACPAARCSLTLLLCRFQGLYTFLQARLTCARGLQRRRFWAWQQCSGRICCAERAQPARHVASVLQRALVRPAPFSCFLITLGHANLQAS